MKFAIVVLSPPQAPSARRALLFCEALLAGGHELSRLFLYRDGVHNASHALVSGQDESDLPARWRELIEGSLTYELIRSAGNISVHVIAGAEGEAGTRGFKTAAKSG